MNAPGTNAAAAMSPSTAALPAPCHLDVLEDEAVIEFAEVLHFDPYSANRAMGSFILIDGASKATLAAGLIEPGVH